MTPMSDTDLAERLWAGATEVTSDPELFAGTRTFRISLTHIVPMRVVRAPRGRCQACRQRRVLYSLAVANRMPSAAFALPDRWLCASCMGVRP
jgi:hypothetical protein